MPRDSTDDHETDDREPVDIEGAFEAMDPSEPDCTVELPRLVGLPKRLAGSLLTRLSGGEHIRMYQPESDRFIRTRNRPQTHPFSERGH